MFVHFCLPEPTWAMCNLWLVAVYRPCQKKAPFHLLITLQCFFPQSSSPPTHPQNTFPKQDKFIKTGSLLSKHTCFFKSLGGKILAASTTANLSCPQFQVWECHSFAESQQWLVGGKEIAMQPINLLSKALSFSLVNILAREAPSFLICLNDPGRQLLKTLSRQLLLKPFVLQYLSHIWGECKRCWSLPIHNKVFAY